MKKLFWFTFLISLGFTSAFPQTIQVIEKVTGLPISDVALFNRGMNKSILSDKHGHADLAIFNNNDTIYFQHPSFKRIALLKSEIAKNGNIVRLENEVRMLKEFVISVSKWEQNKKEVPNKIRSIPQKEIAFYNPQTAADLLSLSNSVFLQKSQLGGGSPMIRGFSANSVLLVVDGVRMNNAIYRSGNLQNVISLDPNVIRESEVVYGPGSVVYGSDALGGVMDFHTIEPQFSENDTVKTAANALMRFTTANSERTGHFDFQAGWQKWAFLSSISFSNFSDLRMGSVGHPSYQRPEFVIRFNNRDTIVSNTDPDLQRFSGYSQWNLMQKIRFSPDQGKKLNFSYAFHYSSTSDVPRYDRLLQTSHNRLKYSQWYYGPQRWMLHSLSANLNRKTYFSDEARIVFAYQNYQESRHDRKFQSDNLRHRTENVNAWSFNVDLNKSINPKQIIFYGLEAVLNQVNSTGVIEDILSGTTTKTASRYPNGFNNYKTIAAYTSWKYNFLKQFTLNAGLRYNYISLYSTIADNSYYSFPFTKIQIKNGALNGSFGLVYRPEKKTQLNLNASSGFRAPNLDDIGKIFDSEPGNVVVPNKNLKPEYSYNIDIGWIQTMGDTWKMEISGFSTWVQNAMVRRKSLFNGQDSILYDGEMSKVYAVVNAASATLHGVSFSLEGSFTSRLSFSSDFTYIKGADQDGTPLRHVPPFYGGTHLIFNKAKFKGDFYMLFNGQITNKNLAPSEQSKTYMYESDKNGLPYSPGWYTFNLKTSVSPIKNLRVQAGVENILNVRYRPYSSGIVSPGRNFFIALRINIS